MAHCCALGINMAINAVDHAVHHVSIWLDTVHPYLNDVFQHQYSPMLYESCINMAHWCASCIRRQYGSMLWSGVNIILYNGSVLCITHQYGSMLCIHGSMMCIRHHYDAIWALCIIVQLKTVHASCINMAKCGAATTEAVHHASVWLNTA